jgi:HK97 gp10 family phage protein
VARKKITYESRIEEAKKKIQEKPREALKEIGKFLSKEVRDAAPKSKESRTYVIHGRRIMVKPGRLKKSIGYWYRKRDKDLQIGSKAFYAKWVEFGSSKNMKQPFLMPSVEKNVSVIQSMIAESLRELTKK